MTVPDAWDECGGCGHDYDDHGTAGKCAAWYTHAGMQQQCWCRAFREPAA